MIRKSGFRFRAVSVRNTFVRVRPQSRDDRFGPLNAGIDKRLFVECIARHGQQPFRPGRHRNLGVHVDNHKRSSAAGEFLGQAFSHPAQPAKNRVAFELFNFACHAAVSQGPVDLPFDHQLQEQRQRVTNRQHAKQNDEDGEELLRWRDFADFGVAHARYGDDKVVDRLEPVAATDGMMSDDAYDKHGDQRHDSPANSRQRDHVV